MICKRCEGEMSKNGTSARSGVRVQKYKCKKCGHESRDDSGHEPKEILAEKIAGITEDQFRAKFDLNFIVGKKCKELQKGIYLSMSEFIKLCCITPGSGYRQVLEHPDFDSYRGRIRGDIYWSHPESISKMKAEGILN